MGPLGDSAECALGAAELREADVFMHSSPFFIGGGLDQPTLPPALLVCPSQGRTDPQVLIVSCLQCVKTSERGPRHTLVCPSSLLGSPLS